MNIATETEDGQTTRSATLMLHLLGRCNLSCLHCYMGGSPSRTERLPLGRVRTAIAQAAALDIGALYVTGGEPILYPHLEEVVEAAAQVDGLRITLCTNATLVTERHASMLRVAGAKVNVSIDGEASFHDFFRNRPGAFAAAQRGIRKLVDAGIAVTIVSTLSQGNLSSLGALAAWASQMGAAQFRVQPLLRLGRGVDIADQRLTPAQLNRLIMELSDLANTHRAAGLACGLIGVSHKFVLAHPCGAYVCNGTGCHRHVAKEIKKLVVREDGIVLPEVTNLHHSFALGNLLDRDLLDMVAGYFEAGYDDFDRLCRSAYDEVIPTWQSALVPWDQILAERSLHFDRGLTQPATPLVHACGTPSPGAGETAPFAADREGAFTRF